MPNNEASLKKIAGSNKSSSAGGFDQNAPSSELFDNGPQPVLSLLDAIALIVGIVLGAGIFRAPSLVAANAGSEQMFLGAWALGGLISLVGALCYAELASTFPSAGGDYHFLSRAYNKQISFLFAWARMSVIQTGSVALLAFIFGDYASQVYRLGDYSTAIYAVLAVIILTGLNIAGLTLGTGTQKLLTAVEVFGVLAIIVTGLFFVSNNQTDAGVVQTNDAASSIGLTLVFVLLTYGGWDEAAYISAEMRAGRRRIAGALVLGILIITALYLLVNTAYLNALGIQNLAKSEAVAGDVMGRAFGKSGAILIGLLIAISALTSANATIFTGARTNYALGRDFPVFGFLGKWNKRSAAPINALVIQGLISLALVGFGIFTRKNFETIVEYTAPVFWVFFLLTGISLFILRRKEPNVERPFRVPLYPLTPLIFCLSSAYLLYSSLIYTGIGALIGVGVLTIGALILLALPRLSPLPPTQQTEGRSPNAFSEN